MTKIEKVWLACAIDGEGYINITDRIDPRTGWRVRSVGLGVCNTDLRFVREAARLLGNPHIYNHRPRTHIGKTSYAGKKPVYQARLKDRNKVSSILTEIRPYLIIKGEKADAAVRFVETTDWTRRRSAKVRAQMSTRMRKLWATGQFTGTRGMKIERRSAA